jgi:cytoplasmic iron level regulating protein YaaA (DUF328/UPF0246 family)
MKKGLAILLPPSEGKSESAKGKKLDLAQLSFSKLKPARQVVVKELVELCQQQPSKAQKVLKLSAKQVIELEMNKNLLKRPTGQAVDIYTGVLYEAMNFSALTRLAKDWIGKRVFISSALFGMVSALDKIPAYRLSGDVTLPKLGSLKKYWLSQMPSILDKYFADYLVLDLRSGIYADMWKPSQETLENFVVGKIVQKQKQNGKTVYKTVSHHNKATKGKLVAALAAAKANPKTPEELAKIVNKLGFEAHLEPKKKNNHHNLTIVMP